MAAGKFASDRLSAALLQETDAAAALRLFLNPPNATPSAPFRYSVRCYDLIISKLAAARLFPAMESILSGLPPSGTGPREHILCQVISAYGRARRPAAARRAFAHPAFPEPRTAHAVNTLLTALLACRSPLRELLAVCRDAGVSPNVCTYNILMRAAAASGSLEHVRHLFDEMLLLGVSPTADTFGIMVAALCDADKLEEAFEVKEAMVRQHNVSPNTSVYASLIKVLCQRRKVDAAMRLKDEMARNRELKRGSAVYGALVRALYQIGRKDEVAGLLKEMKDREIAPHRVVFNAMIAGLCEDERDAGAALAVLDDMKEHGCKPDGVTYSTLVAGLCKLGKWRDATEVVKDMPRRGFPPDVVIYRVLFDGLCAAGEFHEANKVLGDMLVKGFAPRMDGARKFVEGLEKEGDAALLESVLCRLVMVNALESGGWEKAVGGMLNDNAKLRLEKQLESIRFT